MATREQLHDARAEEVGLGRMVLMAAQRVYRQEITDEQFWEIIEAYNLVCEKRRKLLEESESNATTYKN